VKGRDRGVVRHLDGLEATLIEATALLEAPGLQIDSSGRPPAEERTQRRSSDQADALP
jgi:hypothetical protein